MLIALSLGLIFLLVYGLFLHHRPIMLAKMAVSGIIPAKNIFIVMLMVGAMTALWRESGTIAYIVSISADTLRPGIFLPASFALCSAISVLTGTSVGTAATIGAICMGVGTTIGIHPAICGGAALSGAFFGDRCSPVSTSALLVAQVTHTSIYDNIRQMIRTGIIPFLLSLFLFTALGLFSNGVNFQTGITTLFDNFFNIHWILAAPAASIIILALFRIDVKINMLVSIVLSAALAMGIQGAAPTSVLQTMATGFNAPKEIAPMISGGGMASMIKLCVTVAISLTYVGLIKGTGIIDKIRSFVQHLSKRMPPFGCTFMAATTTCMVSCNQTMSIIFTNELCEKVVPDNAQRAIFIENTSVVVAGIIPWSMASLIPLKAMGAPTESVIYAFFLYLVIIVQWVAASIRQKRAEK